MRSGARVLLTGGAGYVGSHVAVQLLAAGHQPTIFDNFSNSHPTVMEGIRQLTGRTPEVLHGDVRDTQALTAILKRLRFDAVMHFAGYKTAAESIASPLRYHDCNFCGTLSVLQAMQEVRLRRFVFSSSATVYGAGSQKTLPFSEDTTRRPISPYGRIKAMVEDMLHDLKYTDENWSIATLRYFNPVGAHESGLIGENPKLPTLNNLMPCIAQVATGSKKTLQIFGGDYSTPDGTALRDYIHVMDLAEGHVRTLNYLGKMRDTLVLNLGTGRPYSVLEVVDRFERASQRSIPYEICARRSGDTAACWADPGRAKAILGWQATRNMHTICRDEWHWQSRSEQTT